MGCHGCDNVKARTGGKRVGLNWGKLRVNRAVHRCDWGCIEWGGMSWS